ncbi:PorT family protein [Pontibacter sp. KCTC 32443]|uniref:porin family protein n=1 Tax=Pontibacter TaxID=323449 RepID=UPI00164DB82A|nr:MULTISPECIES: porin family protein [Pontibacter]MBC5772924.1 PorT family protein [Pontibacter sp. KCTC 32443]
MKIKIFLVLLFIVSIGFTSTAQTVSIGPRVGLNFATQVVTGDDSQYADDWNDEVKAATGAQVGLATNFMLGEVFSIQPEFLYTQKGYRFEDADETVTGKYDYIDVPVLAKLSFGSPQLKGFVTAGPTFSYWMGGKDTFESDGMDFSEDIDFDNEDDGIENQFEAGASIGLGLAYLIGTGTFNVDVRYGAGLSSVYDTDDDAKLKNNGVSVSVAYLFGL